MNVKLAFLARQKKKNQLQSSLSWYHRPGGRCQAGEGEFEKKAISSVANLGVWFWPCPFVRCRSYASRPVNLVKHLSTPRPLNVARQPLVRSGSASHPGSRTTTRKWRHFGASPSHEWHHILILRVRPSPPSWLRAVSVRHRREEGTSIHHQESPYFLDIVRWSSRSTSDSKQARWDAGRAAYQSTSLPVYQITYAITSHLPVRSTRGR